MRLRRPEVGVGEGALLVLSRPRDDLELTRTDEVRERGDECAWESPPVEPGVGVLVLPEMIK